MLIVHTYDLFIVHNYDSLISVTPHLCERGVSQYPRGNLMKNNHCTIMRVFIYGIFEVCIVPQLLLSYFHSIPSPVVRSLLWYPCYYLYTLTTGRYLQSWISVTPLSSATTGQCIITCTIYICHLTCLFCARVVAAMSPLQGVWLNLQIFSMRREPQFTQGPSPTQVALVPGLQYGSPIWPFRRYTSPPEWAYVA